MDMHNTLTSGRLILPQEVSSGHSTTEHPHHMPHPCLTMEPTLSVLVLPETTGVCPSMAPPGPGETGPRSSKVATAFDAQVRPEDAAPAGPPTRGSSTQALHSI
jgi:hypothetical protein